MRDSQSTQGIVVYTDGQYEVVNTGHDYTVCLRGTALYHCEQGDLDNAQKLILQHKAKADDKERD